VEQAKMLVEASCDELQGYLFGKPAPNEIVQKASKQAREQWSSLL
jgi:EAL domain-containing protein (putative c-di-GMP-specific phosphodiesterase class I)